MTDHKLRVALIGGRGIPARYGGFETMMEEVAPRLARSGFEVTVYCRSHQTSEDLISYRGVRLVRLPTIRTKHFETPVHTLLSCLHAMGRYDCVLMVNGVNVVFIPLLRVSGIRTALNVDGIERQRAKWGVLGKLAYQLSERLSVWWPDVLITDAKVIHDYYRRQHSKDSEIVTYGIAESKVAPGDTLREFGLEPNRYFLYVSRFEPENNPHRVIEGFLKTDSKLPLVMVGWAPYADKFIRSFREAAGERVIFAGARYGDQYLELLSNPFAYIQATEVGGTHPALVEAMGFGNCVLANETPENREVAGETAIYFKAREPDTLATAIQWVLEDADKESYGRAAYERARERYSWDKTSSKYGEIFRTMANKKRTEPNRREPA